jgi:hypothetical protein
MGGNNNFKAHSGNGTTSTSSSRVGKDECDGRRLQRVDAAGVGFQGLGVSGLLGGRLAARVGPTCDGFRTAQGAVLDWPDCGGEIKMAERQPVALPDSTSTRTRASSC